MEMYTDAWVSVNAAHVKPFEPLLNGCNNYFVANG